MASNHAVEQSVCQQISLHQRAQDQRDLSEYAVPVCGQVANSLGTLDR